MRADKIWVPGHQPVPAPEPEAGPMPNLGVAEIFAILVVALVVLGPKRLPEVGRKIGGFVRELRSHSESVKAELRDVIDIDGVAENVNSVRRDLKEAVSIGPVFDGTSASPTTPDAAPATPGTPDPPSPEDINPMMRPQRDDAVGLPPGPPAAKPGPTRRLPGAGTSSDGGSDASGDAPGADEVTRRLPTGRDGA